jgi:hypothetical protein
LMDFDGFWDGNSWISDPWSVILAYFCDIVRHFDFVVICYSTSRRRDGGTGGRCALGAHLAHKTPTNWFFDRLLNKTIRATMKRVSR